MPTTVIKVRGRDRDVLLADPAFVYVGRKFAGFEASPFGNPFRATAYGWEALVKFEEELLLGFGASRPHSRAYAEYFREMVRRIPELRGKVLGCWCGCWSPGEPDLACHAVVLAKLADGPHGDPRS